MKKKIIVMLLLPFILIGCSSTFAYNNIDWLLYWYLDDYVELNKSQKKIFDTKLDVWLRWHRKEELVQYKNQLLSLKQRLNAGPLASEEWLNEFDTARNHWTRLRDRVGPDLVEFVPKLSDEQVDNLFDALEEQNIENEQDRDELTEAERREERIDDLQDQLKSYVGKLNKDQKALVVEYEPRFKTNFDNWIAYRRKVQAEAKQIIQRRNSDPDFANKLTEIMRHPEAYQSPEYQDVSAYNRVLSTELTAELNLSFTPKQMRKLNKKIDDLLEDLEDLIND